MLDARVRERACYTQRVLLLLLARVSARLLLLARRHARLEHLSGTVWLGGLAILLACGACSREADHDALCAALSQHRVATLYGAKGTLSCPGVKQADIGAALQTSLRGEDIAQLRAALSAHKTGALVVRAGAAKGDSLAGRLSRYAFLPGMRALALSHQLALYAPAREAELSSRERDGIGYVTRALLRGAREPSLNSFPPALRRVERLEVMVLLRERGSARLWRSARGTSIARALLTATRVARERWRERESAMGGPLHERLLDLDVEVSLLSEDGVIVNPTQRVVDRVVGPEHGIGFEYKSGWHYLLPEDVKRRGNGSAYRALLALMSEQGAAASGLSAGTLRVYRFVTLTLGTSSAPLSGASPG